MTNTFSNTANLTCPCDPQRDYQQCCAIFHQHRDTAQTPEQLMRSRYSAFVKGEYQYLLDTHHPEYRHGLTLADLQPAPDFHWLGLEVLTSASQGNTGQVTFKAWFKQGKHIDAIFEASEFVFENEQWFYTKGQQFNTPKRKANEPCVCGSEQKFKRCCGR